MKKKIIHLLLVVTLFSLQGCATLENNNILDKLKSDPARALGTNPSEKLQLKAISVHSWSIKYIKNPSEAVQLASVNKNWANIAEIKNPTEKVQILAIKRNARAINLIKKPSESANNYLKNRYLKSNNYQLDDYHYLINNKRYSIWDLDSKNINIPESIEVTVLRTMKKTIQSTNNRYGDKTSMTGHYHRFMKKIKSESAQLYIVNKEPDSIKYIKIPHSSVKNNPKFIAYKREKKIAEIKRKKEDAEYAKRMKNYSSSNSSSSNSSSNSYSAPQRTCHNVTRTKTVYVPGGSGRTALQNYTEVVCN